MKKQEKILLVDDEQNNLSIYSKIFEEAGYKVFTAINSSQTFSILEKYSPDLVLLDVNLGNESGFDILKRIKSTYIDNFFYVVMISGQFTSSEDQSQGLELGADGYFSRPIEKRELLARVEAYMRHKRTINDLKESEERFRTIIQKNPDAILIIDQEGVIRFANPAAEELFKITIDDLLRRVFGYPIVTGENTEINVFRSDSENRIAEMRVIDINWSNDKVLLTSIRDISKHKNIQKKLALSEQKLRSIISSIPLPLYLWRFKDGNFFLEQYNETANDISDGKISEFLGVNIDDFYSSEQDLIAIIEETFIKKVTLEVEREYTYHANNEKRNLKVMCTFVPPDFVMVITEDYTELELSKKAIIDERNKANQYLNIAASIILALDKEGKITLINDSGAGLLEAKREDIIGKDWFKTFLPAEESMEVKGLFTRFCAGEDEMMEYHDNEIVTSKGKRRKIRWHNNLVHDEDGSITGLLSSGEDVTDKLLTTKALRESENKYAELFMHMHNGVMILNYLEDVGDFVLENANEAALNILKINLRSEEENAIKNIYPTCQESGLWDVLYKVRKTGIPENFPVAYYKNKQLNLYTENSVYKLPSGEIVLVFNDITKKILSEEALRKSIKDISKLTERLEAVREEERRDIASVLHDDLGQLLTAIKMELTWLKNNTPEHDSIFRKRLQSGNEIVEHAIKSVQKISSELRPPVLDNLGLIQAIEQFVNEFSERTNIKVKLILPRENIALPDQFSISIFRMIQESFTNIARHANAKSAILTISKKSDTLEIHIEDDGIGIPERNIDSSNSLGIIGIREKVSRCNGDFQIVGLKEKGTALEIKLPIN